MHVQLLARQPGIRVEFTKERGKSIVATKVYPMQWCVWGRSPHSSDGHYVVRHLQTFHKGDLILDEAPLAAAQDPANSRVVLACHHCFRILGPSLEAHIGRAIQGVWLNVSLCHGTHYEILYCKRAVY